MWGRGPRGSNGTCSTLCQPSVSSPTAHKQSGPFWCWFLCGWVCICSRTLWVSPTNSPLRLGVSPAAASTPKGFPISGLRLYFSEVEPWGCAVCFAPPLFLPVYLCTNVGLQATAFRGLPAASCQPAAAWTAPLHNPPPRWVHQPLSYCESSPPSCASPPLLLVWMNVSSLKTWLLDFHTVRFSVSSGCFLFLNCCCPFGCVRRHSVSTYTSILAGSQDQFLILETNPAGTPRMAVSFKAEQILAAPKDVLTLLSCLNYKFSAATFLLLLLLKLVRGKSWLCLRNKGLFIFAESIAEGALWTEH